MTNEVVNNNEKTKKEELELLMLVFPDLTSVLDSHQIKVCLPCNIEVVFTLPDGYPSKCSPKHNIHVPASLNWIREKINDQLEANYKAYAGYPVLSACVAEINGIAVKFKDKIVSDIPKVYQEQVKSVSKVAQKEASKPQPSQCFNWISGQILEDRKSTFQAHVLDVKSKNEAIMALAQLKENNKISRATHNIYAYIVGTTDNREQYDCEDDGEKTAGTKLLHMLKLMKIKNMIVVVSRWYGGIHLGNDRFRHICNVAQKLIVEYRNST